MIIAYIVADGLQEFNSSQFRVSLPCDALLKARHKVHILNVRQWMARTEYAKQICMQADIIHLQRVLVSDTHDDIVFWRKHGKAVVVDFDDAYDLIHDDNAAAPFWLHGKVNIRLDTGYEYEQTMEEHPVDQFRVGLKKCTALITPSKILSNDWRTGAPEFVVPNFLRKELYDQSLKHDNGDLVYIGWGGSLSHVQSWKDSGINDAMRRLLQDRNHIRLYLIGDIRVKNQLPIRKDRIIFSNYVPWWQWQQTLMHYDIGLAPLAGDYDDRRSDLKVAEYLMAGLPFVATKSPVYEDLWNANSGVFALAGHDENGYNERVESWYNGLIEVVDNIDDYRVRAQENIATYGDRYDIDKQVDSIINVYKEIISLEKQ